MTNYKVDRDGTLRDSSGQDIGKVGFKNQVYDGWQQRGHIADNGRYIDEYGRDMGWTEPGGSSRSDSSTASALGSGCGLLGLLIMGSWMVGTWLRDRIWDSSSPKSSPSNISAPGALPLNTPPHPNKGNETLVTIVIIAGVITFCMGTVCLLFTLAALFMR
jgi:hypothetical protein